jgi:predicted CopG family antitoxin
MAIREPELEIAARIGITPEAYTVLRKMKKDKGQSMVRIVSDLIMDNKKTELSAPHTPCSV